MIRFTLAPTGWLQFLQKRYTSARELTAGSFAVRYWAPKGSWGMLATASCMKHSFWNLIAFSGGRFPRALQERLKLKPNWWTAGDVHLYWNPYCNGLWEIQCIFWWVFESVGPHKRSQTLPVMTSDNKYISNIKIKIKIFSSWFSSDFELDSHPQKWWILQ